MRIERDDVQFPSRSKDAVLLTIYTNSTTILTRTFEIFNVFYRKRRSYDTRARTHVHIHLQDIIVRDEEE